MFYSFLHMSDANAEIAESNWMTVSNETLHYMNRIFTNIIVGQFQMQIQDCSLFLFHSV